MSEKREHLPHTICVKGRYWYFRHPKLGREKLPGVPGEFAFQSRYKWLCRRAGLDVEARKAKYKAQREAKKAAVRARALVYFIGMEPDGPVKIGNALKPTERLSTLQTAVPQPLAILATCEGGRGREKEYHARFADACIRGEWYQRTPEILAEIAILAGEGKNVNVTTLVTTGGASE